MNFANSTGTYVLNEITKESYISGEHVLPECGVLLADLLG